MGSQSGTRTRLLCPECNSENFVNLNKLAGDEVLCSCGAKIDVSLIKYSLTSSTGDQQDTGGYPRMLGRYRLVKKLGSGGQAEVHLGVDTLGRKVAVKEYSAGAEEWDQTLNEARCSMRCSGLNVVNTYDILEEDRIIVQEYADGETLRKVITARVADVRDQKQTLFPVEQVVDIITGVLQGLQVCHVRGVIHLDIKPENVMIDSTSGLRIPKVFDFGLAHNLREEGDRTATGKVVLARTRGDQSFQGTPAYAAPEQIDPKRKSMISARTDIYQAGVLFYELLCGRTPFEGKGWEDIFRGILSWTPVALSDRSAKVPLELVAIQERMCAREGDRRYPSVSEVLDDLERWRANRSVAEHMESTKRSRRNRFFLTFCAGLLLGGAAGLAPGASKYLFTERGTISSGQLEDSSFFVIEQADRAVREIRKRDGTKGRALELISEAERMLGLMESLVPQSKDVQNLRLAVDERKKEIERAPWGQEPEQPK